MLLRYTTNRSVVGVGMEHRGGDNADLGGAHAGETGGRGVGGGRDSLKTHCVETAALHVRLCSLMCSIPRHDELSGWRKRKRGWGGRQG